jgi:GMP synthase PP-ATPase subunit
MKKILTLSIGFVLTMVSVAQKHTPFPVEDEKFLKELSQQFESQVKGLGKELIKDKLEPSWLTPGTFTVDEKKQVRESLDLLLTKRYQTVPVLQNYIETILALKESGKSEYFNSFQQVFIACINMSSNKTNKHVDHLSIIAKTLFKSNALFVGPSHEWKFENNSYTFGLRKSIERNKN